MPLCLAKGQTQTLWWCNISSKSKSIIISGTFYQVAHDITKHQIKVYDWQIICKVNNSLVWSPMFYLSRWILRCSQNQFYNTKKSNQSQYNSLEITHINMYFDECSSYCVGVLLVLNISFNIDIPYVTGLNSVEEWFFCNHHFSIFINTPFQSNKIRYKWKTTPFTLADDKERILLET